MFNIPFLLPVFILVVFYVLIYVSLTRIALGSCKDETNIFTLLFVIITMFFWPLWLVLYLVFYSAIKILKE